MRPVFGSTPPQKLIGAESTSASPSPAAPGTSISPGSRAAPAVHAPSSVITGRPATALSTQSASEA